MDTNIISDFFSKRRVAFCSHLTSHFSLLTSHFSLLTSHFSLLKNEIDKDIAQQTTSKEILKVCLNSDHPPAAWLLEEIKKHFNTFAW